MTLIRRTHPEFPLIAEWLEDFFGKESDGFFPNPKRTIPSVNILETNQEYKIELAAPGLVKDDFKIDLNNDVLAIIVEKEMKTEEPKQAYTKKEFNYFAFKRAFTLPDSADREKISAKYEAGILEITIAKKEAAIVKPVRKIDIS